LVEDYLLGGLLIFLQDHVELLLGFLLKVRLLLCILVDLGDALELLVDVFLGGQDNLLGAILSLLELIKPRVFDLLLDFRPLIGLVIVLLKIFELTLKVLDQDLLL